ncbi:MAG: histidinol phosphate phosphatase domain-containing protein [Armatimonadota bacterium]|nr:histidinol phosphate phosphatase domain-containing protein [Armatimonadota bacterium]
MVYDFHTHTTLSDGVLLPMELIRRCIVRGYSALGIADHTSASTMGRVIREVRRDCELARKHWGFSAFPGVELTHVPAAAIGDLAADALRTGAAFVVVHGQSPVEPVEPGTNLAVVSCADVDILAHPGDLTEEEARLAADNGVFLELSARQGHSLGNGRVGRVALEAGAKLLVNSDAHDPDGLLTEEKARDVARLAGLTEAQVEQTLVDNAQELVERIRGRME